MLDLPLKPELMNVFSFLTNLASSLSLDNSKNSGKQKDFSTIFRQIVENATKKVGQLPQSRTRRQKEVVKSYLHCYFCAAMQ